MKKRILWLGLSFLLVTALVLTSCGEVVPGEQEEEEEEITPTTLPAGMGTIEIRVTDPPPPGVKTANVTLTKIEIHKAVTEQEMEQEQSDSNNQTQEPEQQQTQQGEGEWITIIDYEATFNLFEVIEEAAILGSENVTAGKYTQIRMDVIKVEGLTSDDTPYIATVPSGTLKIVRPFEVRDGSTTILTVDFDGDKSLIITGKGKFLFKPVVRLQVERSSPPANGGDTTPPVIDLTGVTEGQIIVSPDTVTPVFSVSDDTDPAPILIATLNGEPFTSGTEVSGVGEYELEVTAIDASDNETEVEVDFEIVEVEDTTPPVIDLTGVTEGQIIVSPDTVTPVFSVSDDTDPAPILIATLNGEPFTSGTEVSGVGEYELEVTAIDASDNETEVEVDFEIVEVEDTTPPVITLTGVTEGQVVISPDTVTPVFSVSDDTDPDPILVATLNGEPFTSGTVVSGVGEYELEVTAIDASDNETEVAVNFEIVAE